MVPPQVVFDILRSHWQMEQWHSQQLQAAAAELEVLMVHKEAWQEQQQQQRQLDEQQQQQGPPEGSGEEGGQPDAAAAAATAGSGESERGAAGDVGSEQAAEEQGRGEEADGPVLGVSSPLNPP